MRKIFLPIMAAIFVLPVVLYAAEKELPFGEEDLPFGVEESFIRVRGGMVRVFDISPKGQVNPVHLLCIPGGPGSSSQVFFSGLILQAFAGYRMCLYDPLGTGKSTPALKKDMEIGDEIKRLHSVCTHYKKKVGAQVPIALYGVSWGAALAAIYASKYPSHISHLILTSPLLSTKEWQSDTRNLLLTLPQEIQTVIDEHEEKKIYNTPEYEEAVEVYKKNFSCKFSRSFTLEELSMYDFCKGRYFGDNLWSNSEIYQAMWGPSEFTVEGSLKNFDCLHRLPLFGQKMPVSILIGESDQILPKTAEKMAKHIDAKLYFVKNASHGISLQNPEALNGLLKAITAQKR